MQQRNFELFTEECPTWAQWELDLIGDNVFQLIENSTVVLIDKDGGERVVLSIEQAMSHSNKLNKSIEQVLKKLKVDMETLFGGNDA